MLKLMTVPFEDSSTSWEVNNFRKIVAAWSPNYGPWKSSLAIQRSWRGAAPECTAWWVFSNLLVEYDAIKRVVTVSDCIRLKSTNASHFSFLLVGPWVPSKITLPHTRIQKMIEDAISCARGLDTWEEACCTSIATDMSTCALCSDCCTGSCWHACEWWALANRNLSRQTSGAQRLSAQNMESWKLAIERVYPMFGHLNRKQALARDLLLDLLRYSSTEKYMHNVLRDVQTTRGQPSLPWGVDVGLLAQTQTAARLAAGRHSGGPKANAMDLDHPLMDGLLVNSWAINSFESYDG